MSDPGTAYYNEFEPSAADWLENLIASGIIAPGIVDRRSIEEVQPDDLRGFTQVHLFAGIGGWSRAARLAGWADTRALWTASCPCQPFSQAGKGRGTDDPRHLWPHVLRLSRAIRPACIVGEQVAAKAGYGWFDGVCADLEAENYASRAVDIPALAVDAPHERNRLYWIAVADAQGGERGSRLCQDRSQRDGTVLANRDGVDPVVNATSIGRGEGRPGAELHRGGATPALANGAGVTQGDACDARSQGIEDTQRLTGHSARWADAQRADGRDGRPITMDHANGDGFEGCSLPHVGQHPLRDLARPNRSFWTGAEWIVCHDGKARRVSNARTPLLAHGVRGRIPVPRPAGLDPATHPEDVRWVSRIAAWKGFGNAIVPPLAAQVIAALADVLDAGEAP